MNRWLICVLIFGVCGIVVRLYDLVRRGRQFSSVKRREATVFLIWYSLLLANILLQQRHPGWGMLTSILMLGFMGYWMFLFYLNAQAKIKRTSEESASIISKTTKT
jgi:hypothetical protein